MQSTCIIYLLQRFGAPHPPVREILIGNVVRAVVFRRVEESVPVLLHLHHVHEGQVGGGEDPRGVREGVSRSPGRGVRALHPRRHPDRQLSEGGRGLQAAAQRSPGQRRSQVSFRFSYFFFFFFYLAKSLPPPSSFSFPSSYYYYDSRVY